MEIHESGSMPTVPDYQKIVAVRVGDVIDIYGKKVVVMDIKTAATVEGMSVQIEACDEDSAQHTQVSQHQSRSMQEQMMNMIQHFFKTKGE